MSAVECPKVHEQQSEDGMNRRGLFGLFVGALAAPIVSAEVGAQGRFVRYPETALRTDPQRMYNYWRSKEIEFRALETKTPWLGTP